ncbi:MAG: restriction endonuclease subunit S [Nitrospirae bacterium]|nr:restriction endonuclease subunit S [Nitrospirota bacterium]
MQYSVVNYKDLEKGSWRLDPEYYHPENLFLLKVLKEQSYSHICDFSFVTDGIHASIEFDDKSKINLLSAKTTKENYFDLSGTGFITKIQDSKNKRTRLKIDDVIISTVGTIGNCAVVDESILPANADRHVGIVRIKKDYKPRFLSSFLLSKYGRFQTFREATGNIQLNLFVYKIKEIVVPRLSFNFQDIIENLCIKANQLLLNSKSLYYQAEQLLLSDLGLSDWKPTHKLAFVKRFSDTKQADRFDAEYFQPKYEEIIDAVKRYKGGFDELGNLVKIKKSVEPGSEAYQESGVPFVRVSNLSKLDISDNNQHFISDKLYNELKTHQPQKGEILLSKDATPGIAYYLNEETQKMIVSGGILRLQIDKQQVLPEYLTLVLNSTIIQKQIERDTGGSIINHWRPDQVETAIIPILKEDKQKKIKELVEQSFNDRKVSKSLFEIAKRGVEMAIEKTEKETETWIKTSEAIEVGMVKPELLHGKGSTTPILSQRGASRP